LDIPLLSGYFATHFSFHSTLTLPIASMAIIGTIRNQFGLLVSGLIILVLLLFVVSSAFDNINALFGGANQSIGSIDGEKITLKRFNEEYQKIERNYLIQSRKASTTEQEASMLREQTWNALIQQIAFRKEYEKLGLEVSQDELTDMVQGNNIHPSVKQNFTDPQTGQFEKANVIRFLNRLDSLPEETRQIWSNFEEEVLPFDRMRMKHEALLKAATFITKAEARREYEAQTAKADVKFLYVPYTSVFDSTIQVGDEEIRQYFNRNRTRYSGKETRDIQYVSFQVVPSAADSTALWNDIKKLARDLATTQEDSLFAAANSDEPFPFSYQGAYQLPKYLQDTLPYFFKGRIIGPYREGRLYSIFKVIDVKEDSLPSVRASHILFRIDTLKESKTQTYNQARKVLADIKSGKISFEAAASQYGTDGTKTQGGDLGWFSKNGQMVKPFEDAIFNFGRTGLMDKVVETQFGYHLIKVTEGPTRTKYRLAGIQKNIVSSEVTREEIFRKADELAGTSQTVDQLKEAVKKNPTLSLLTADNLDPNASSINTLQNAREIVRWAFNDVKVGTVSKQVFDLDNQFVVAALTGKTEKEGDPLPEYREGIVYELKKEAKKKLITQKLAQSKGSLEDIAKAYGPQAQVNTAQAVSLSASSLPTVGFDPVAVGKIFGLKQGQRSKPFGGENGVLILEMMALTPAPDIADYSQYKNQLLQTDQGRISYFLNEAIKEKSQIEDKRYKFY
jgi:peptidyl-prolyl cis-trans isomerase D